MNLETRFSANPESLRMYVHDVDGELDGEIEEIITDKTDYVQYRDDEFYQYSMVVYGNVLKDGYMQIAHDPELNIDTPRLVAVGIGKAGQEYYRGTDGMFITFGKYSIAAEPEELFLPVIRFLDEHLVLSKNNSVTFRSSLHKINFIEKLLALQNVLGGG